MPEPKSSSGNTARHPEELERVTASTTCYWLGFIDASFHRVGRAGGVPLLGHGIPRECCPGHLHARQRRRGAHQ